MADDEPLRITTYTLSADDALVYEQSQFQLNRRNAILLALWLALWGGAALLIPLDWAGPRLGWAFNVLVAILIGVGTVLAMLFVSLRQWRRAQARIERPFEVTINEWPERLTIISTGVPGDIAFADVLRSVLTPTHLFLETRRDFLILPRRAFRDPAAFDELVGRVAETSGIAPELAARGLQQLALEA